MFSLYLISLITTSLFFGWIQLRRSALPKGAPRQIKEGQGIFGAIRFFTARYEFYEEWSKKLKHFSFHIGNNNIISLSGEAARKWFIECPQLSLVDGYTLLVGAASAQHIKGFPYDTIILPRFRKLFRRENLSRSTQTSLIT